MSLSETIVEPVRVGPPDGIHFNFDMQQRAPNSELAQRVIRFVDGKGQRVEPEHGWNDGALVRRRACVCSARMGFVAYRRLFFDQGHGLAGAQPVEHFERLIHERWAEDSSIGAHELGQSRPLSRKTPGFVAAIREAD